MPRFDRPWWPAGYDPLTEPQVRELFAWLRRHTRPIMTEGEHRIRAVVGPDVPILTHYQTVRSMAERRLGQVDVVTIITLYAGTPQDDCRARWIIGVGRDGQMMVTPNLNPATHLEWEPWSSMQHSSA